MKLLALVLKANFIGASCIASATFLRHRCGASIARNFDCACDTVMAASLESIGFALMLPGIILRDNPVPVRASAQLERTRDVRCVVCERIRRKRDSRASRRRAL